jgi:antitoxin (DNA-binding transcriptional repressor) of toxin-antitoxin stability system
MYTRHMAKHVIHISETEAASDFSSLLKHVRAGAEVIIESKSEPVAILHAVEPSHRTISECIARAKAYEEETGEAPVLDTDFAEDVEKVIADRKP